ncbi:MAG: cytochrome c nitrite reductase small subunit [candidate division KSB1 bacterium]|nr:cytochrome c nitrite reductase small subunit [candidate division KSB1 bacterium]
MNQQFDFTSRWRETLVVGIAIGLTAGIGVYTFIYAKGASYLTDDPTACANCHVMRDHFEGWIKSPHRAVAVCNDCHTPAGFFAKYATKASNGFWHSFAFTSGRFSDPLRIKPHNLEAANDACRKCHQNIVEAIAGPHQVTSKVLCVRCHHAVGHL